MNFEEAVKKLRADNSIGVIWYGFTMDDDFYFLVSPHKMVIPSDTEAYVAVVSNDSIYKEKSFPIVNSKLMDAFNKKIFIDMDESDIDKIK